MEVKAIGLSDVGRQRQHNEDSFFADPVNRLFLVADGMGGHAAGEIASRIAVDSVAEFITHVEDDEGTWPLGFDDRFRRATNKLVAALQIANRRVVDAMRQDQRLRGMGTTLVAATVEGDVASFAHVGDSRAYMIRDGAITRLTDDHSWVFEQVQAGMLSADEAERHPLRNVITRALGGAFTVTPDAREVECRPGDLYLLCSDGLTSMVSEEEILQIVTSEADLEKACAKLIDAANESGGLDNITAILIQVS